MAWADSFKPERVVPALLMLLIGVVGWDGERMITRQDEQDKTDQMEVAQMATNTADIANLKITTVNNRLYIVAVDNRVRDLEAAIGRPNAYPPQYPPDPRYNQPPRQLQPQVPQVPQVPQPGQPNKDMNFTWPDVIKPEKT